MIQIIPPQSGTFCLQNLKRPTKLYASFIVISTRYINLCLNRCPDMLHISRHLQTECQALNCFWGFPLNCLKYLCLSKPSACLPILAHHVLARCSCYCICGLRNVQLIQAPPECVMTALLA